MPLTRPPCARPASGIGLNTTGVVFRIGMNRSNHSEWALSSRVPVSLRRKAMSREAGLIPFRA